MTGSLVVPSAPILGLDFVITRISFWLLALPAIIAGGMFLKIIDLLIAWVKERREQKKQEVVHEKDRPRFRVDVTVPKTSHSTVGSAIVEILSLGGLPLTINHGEIFIEASHYPEHVEPKKLDGREISPSAPIKFEFSLPLKLVNPLSGGKPLVKLKCHFSYGKDNQNYYKEWIYNRNNREFE